MRLAGIKVAPAVDAMDIDHKPSDVNYPPTFNVQNEVVRFTVRFISHYAQYLHSPFVVFAHRRRSVVHDHGHRERPLIDGYETVSSGFRSAVLRVARWYTEIHNDQVPRASRASSAQCLYRSMRNARL